MRRWITMPNTLKEIDRVDLINIERLAYILKGLSEIEFETLEILLDKEASKTITQSLKELETRKGYQLMSGKRYKKYAAPGYE